MFVVGIVEQREFKIDHPLDAQNKYLYHSFVESPDMMNIYNGNVTTDESGEAVVKMPNYFEALNFEFRYQLTVIGQFAQAIVSRKIKNNEFAIKTSAPGVEVSWQVTGVRRDAWANKNRIQVEVEKDERERGFYLHAEVFNQPEERGIQWTQHPEMMKQMNQRRQEFEKMHASHQPKRSINDAFGNLFTIPRDSAASRLALSQSELFLRIRA